VKAKSWGCKEVAETRRGLKISFPELGDFENGKTIFAQAYGLADREKKTPKHTCNAVSQGSMNKMFTATANFNWTQAGKLKLTDSLGKILEGLSNQENRVEA